MCYVNSLPLKESEEAYKLNMHNVMVVNLSDSG